MKEYLGIVTDIGVRTVRGSYSNYSYVVIAGKNVENLQVIDSLAPILRRQWASGDVVKLAILKRKGEHFLMALTELDGRKFRHPVQPLIDEACIFVMVGFVFGFTGLQLIEIQGMCRVTVLFYAMATLGAIQAVSALNAVRKLRSILVDCLNNPKCE